MTSSNTVLPIPWVTCSLIINFGHPIRSCFCMLQTPYIMNWIVIAWTVNVLSQYNSRVGVPAKAGQYHLNIVLSLRWCYDNSLCIWSEKHDNSLGAKHKRNHKPSNLDMHYSTKNCSTCQVCTQINRQGADFAIKMQLKLNHWNIEACNPTNFMANETNQMPLYEQNSKLDTIHSCRPPQTNFILNFSCIKTGDGRCRISQMTANSNAIHCSNMVH
jgi:hypothetical protein